MAELSQRERAYLAYMLGIEPHVSKKKWGFRNRYCATIGGSEESHLTAMANAGLVVRGREINAGASVFFHVTEAGMDAIGLTSAQKKRAMAAMGTNWMAQNVAPAAG